MIFSDSDSDEAAQGEGPGPAVPQPAAPLCQGGLLAPGAGDYADTAEAKFAEEARPCPFSTAELDFLRLAREKNIPGPLWRGILKWHNAHLRFSVREDPRTYSSAVAARYQAEDKHQHDATHVHTTQLALEPRTVTPFTDPVWLIQDILLDTGLLGSMDLLPQLQRNDPFGPLNKVSHAQRRCARCDCPVRAVVLLRALCSFCARPTAPDKVAHAQRRCARCDCPVRAVVLLRALCSFCARSAAPALFLICSARAATGCLQDGALVVPMGPVYTEACDGAWWVRTQKKCSQAGVYLIAYVLYLDGTWLTKSGTRKSKPLCLSLANLPGKAFRKSAAKRIICQVPDFPCTKKDFGKEEAKAANREQYHDTFQQVCFCAHEMHAPARACAPCAGTHPLCFILTSCARTSPLCARMQVLSSLRHLNGQEVELYVPERTPSGAWRLMRRLCRICLMVLAADYPERCLVCGCRGGADTAYPCTTCQCTKAELGDPLFGARGLPLREAPDEQDRRSRLTAAVNGRARGAVGPARAEATEQSMHITRGPLALEGLDLGEHPRGVSAMHAAVPPDWLHVVYEGIGKDVVGWVCQLAQVRVL